MEDEANDADRRAIEQRAAPPGGLRPRTRADFDAIYTVTPSWDIGRPQETFVGLAEAGAWQGRVLDVGCGTGEHALLAASLGLDVVGIDQARRRRSPSSSAWSTPTTAGPRSLTGS